MMSNVLIISRKKKKNEIHRNIWGNEDRMPVLGKPICPSTGLT